MAEVATFSVERDSSGRSTKKSWTSVEYVLALLGFMAVSAALVIMVDYHRLQGSLKFWISWEQPDFFKPDPDEVLYVGATIVEGAVENGAVCLDGSPPVYHIDRGRDFGINNWFIHIEGGGWCSTNQSCFRRSGSRLGSSRMMEKQTVFGGSLSDSPFKNPEFYNWNRVKVRYCDGGSFSGDVESPLEYKFDETDQAKKIYFRGQRIWQAVMDDLLSKGMMKAEKALLSGCSAGAVAAIIHCDSFRKLLPASATVKCMSDAGVFLDVKDVKGNPTIRSFYDDVVSLHGINKQLPQACTENKKGNQCFFPQYLLKTIKTPLFILNPAYDVWQIENVLVPTSADPSGDWSFCKRDPAECTKEQLKILQDFRVKLLEAIEDVEGSEDGGLFINSCFIHCQSEHDTTWHRSRTPVVKHRTISETVGDWFYKRRRTKDIDCPYPCNPSCFNIGAWGSPPTGQRS